MPFPWTQGHVFNWGRKWDWPNIYFKYFSSEIILNWQMETVVLILANPYNYKFPIKGLMHSKCIVAEFHTSIYMQDNFQKALDDYKLRWFSFSLQFIRDCKVNSWNILLSYFSFSLFEFSILNILQFLDIQFSTIFWFSIREKDFHVLAPQASTKRWIGKGLKAKR